MKLVVGKYRYLKNNYTTVGVEGLWETEQYRKIDWWCREQFGPAGDIWASPQPARYYMHSGQFFFRDEKDACWFLLRWS